MQMIEISKLKPHSRNHEFFDDITGEKWNDFLESIKRRNIIEALVVTEDAQTHELIIVSGHQRKRAAKELGFLEVPCRVIHYPEEDERLHIKRDDMILEDLICTNIMQRGVGNINPMKMCKCIIELERIYGIQHGNNQRTTDNLNSSKTQKDIANDLSISVQQLQDYKKLNDLVPELQSMVSHEGLKATTAYKVWAKLPQEEQEEFFNQLGRDKIKKLTQKQTEEEISKIRNKYEEENDKLRKQLEQEKNRESEVIDKTDYEAINKIKAEKRELELKIVQLTDKLSEGNITYKDRPETLSELERLKKQVKDKEEIINKNRQLSDELNENKILMAKFTGENTNLKLITSTSENRQKIMSFLKDMSEYDYLAETFNEIPDATRKEWVRSIYGVYKWAKNILDIVKHDDIIGVDKKIIDADYKNINDGGII